MASKRDYYEILGVVRESDDETIKRAYRQMAMKYHPDRNAGDEEAAVMFKECAEAYEVLRDPAKRQRYDRYGHAGLEGMGGSPNFNNAQSVFDLFGDIFGDIFGGQRGGRGPRAGGTIQHTVEIDLLEAFRGTTKSITVPREELCNDCSGSGCRRGTQPATCRRCNGQGVVLTNQGFFRMQQTCRGCGGRGVIIADPCPNCHGNGRVTQRRSLDITIPPGVDTGNRILHSGEGEAGEPGAPRGDLLILIRVKEHPIFQRDGAELVCTVPITFSQAALGGEIEVPTLEGTITHKLKRGIQSGEVLQIAGRGMPNLRGGRPGNLLVQLVIETPKNLTKRQEELFHELAELDHNHVQPQRKGFLDKLKQFFGADGSGPTTDKKPTT